MPTYNFKFAIGDKVKYEGEYVQIGEVVGINKDKFGVYYKVRIDGLIKLFNEIKLEKVI